jgi:hypothetical protein
MNSKMRARIKKIDAYCDKHLFYGLTNLNDGFDITSIKYFSEKDFEVVLERVKTLGFGSMELILLGFLRINFIILVTFLKFILLIQQMLLGI